MKDYKELEVWKKSRELVNEIYTITKLFPKEEVYGLSNQIRRCAVSIPSNIAEGIGRNTSKDTQQFLFIARGSLYELETQLYISSDQNYISQEQSTELLNKIIECKKLLNDFINHFAKL